MSTRDAIKRAVREQIVVEIRHGRVTPLATVLILEAQERIADAILAAVLTEERCDERGRCTPMRRWVTPWELTERGADDHSTEGARNGNEAGEPSVSEIGTSEGGPEAWLRVQPCQMDHEPPFNFAQCLTHDRTVPLGESCDHEGLSELAWLEAQEQQQRSRAVLAEARAARAEDRLRTLKAAAHITAPPDNLPIPVVDADNLRWAAQELENSSHPLNALVSEPVVRTLRAVAALLDDTHITRN